MEHLQSSHNICIKFLSLGSQLDMKAIRPLDQSASIFDDFSKKRIGRASSTMQQQQIIELEEELRRTKEQLGAAEEVRDRALDELLEMKMVAQAANMRLSEELSSQKTQEVCAELSAVKESLADSKREVKIKDNNIKSLKLELERTRQFEIKLAEREAMVERLKEELSSVKASESKALGLLSESKASESKMYDTVVSQTKQLEQTKIELEECKYEITSLHDKLAKLGTLTMSSDIVLDGSHSCKNVEYKSRLQLAEGNLDRGKVGEQLDYMNVLKNELKLAMEAEERSKEAMDDLALVLKEVSKETTWAKGELSSTLRELEHAKEDFSSTLLELEHAKREVEELWQMLRSTEDRYQKLLYEAMKENEQNKKENEQNKKTVERLRLEAEESLLAWRDKEMGFVSCIKRGEEERTLAFKDNIRLSESLRAAQDMTRLLREENHNLRDVLKQTISEADAAKENATIARAEISQFKDHLAQMDESLSLLTLENERLRISEAGGQESIKQLKHLLSASSTKLLKSKDKEEGSKSRKFLVKEHESEKVQKAFSFDLHELKSLNGEIVNEDHEKAEALKGSIFDNLDSQNPSSSTSRSSSFHRRRGPLLKDDGETINSEHSNNQGAVFCNAENDRNSQRKNRALLRRFSDLLTRKSSQRREHSME